MNWNYLTNVNQRVTWCLVQSHYTDSPFLMHCHLARAVQFSSVQSLSRVRLSATPWTSARQASLSITNFWSLPKLTSIESVMPSNHLILCCPLILLPSIFPSIRIFSNEFSSSHQVAKILELDTRIQNILLATIAYSSVGTLLCPHARWHHL